MSAIGALLISDDMLLSGVVESSQVAYQQKRTVEGYSSVKVYPRVGGRPLTFGSDTSGGTVMGIWCQSLIEDIKLLELTGVPQTLDYRGNTHSVYIVDTSDFTPLFKWEEESPTKKYTGTIKLIEA